MQDLGGNLASLAEFDRNARDLSVRDMTEAIIEITSCLPCTDLHDITYTRSAEVQADTKPRQALRRLERNPNIDPPVYDFVSNGLLLHQTLDRMPSAGSGSVRSPVAAAQRPDHGEGRGRLGDVCLQPADFDQDVAASLARFPRKTAQPLSSAQPAMAAHHERDLDARHEAQWKMSALGSTCFRKSQTSGSETQPGGAVALQTGGASVDINEEYFLFRKNVGGVATAEGEIDEFRTRLKEYVLKASREARPTPVGCNPTRNTRRCCKPTSTSCLTTSDFSKPADILRTCIVLRGHKLSLTASAKGAPRPGFPDFYRAHLGISASSIPHNRRPVNFAPLTDFSWKPRELLDDWRDGRVKIFLTEKLLGFRKGNSELFENGEYIPLTVSGRRTGNVFAYARRVGRTLVY